MYKGDGMTKKMTLHALIDQVKTELLTPIRADSADDLYPFLFVDEVTLEVDVAVTDTLSDSGKLTLYVLEAGAEGEKRQQQGHKVTITLSPLVTKEEMRARLKLDGRLWQGIEKTSDLGTVKEIPLDEG
jgi:hypothetical protein